MSLNQANYTLHDLPLEDRPRERLLQSGSDALSNAELLAIILGSGTRGKSVLQLAQEVLARFGTLENLSKATVSELCTVKGIGKAKAIQIAATLGIGKRAAMQQRTSRCHISTPTHAYHLLRDELEGQQREHFVALMLDTKGFVIAKETIGVGTLTEVLVHPREVFHPAIRHCAHSILVAHNHPSGDPTPSSQDRLLTTQLVEVGELLDIPLRDHLIIGNEGFLSLRQLGVGF